MKLKQRFIAWLAIGLVCGVFVVLHLLTPRITPNAPVHNKHGDTADTDQLQKKSRELVVQLKEPSGEQVEHSGPMPVDKTLFDVKAHLAVMRKDLDMSNYSSNGEQHNLSSKRQILQDYILKDHVFRDNADEIAEIAAILKDNGVIKISTSNISAEEKSIRPKQQSKVEGLYSHEKVPQSEHTAPNKSNEVPYKTFPYKDRQDDRMKYFHFSSASYKTLATQMEQYHQTHRKRVKNDEPTILKNPYKQITKSYQTWHSHISQYELYSPTDPAFQDVLHELSQSKLVDLYQHEGGTQIKLVYYLESGLRSMFKPQRYPKEQETLPDHFYFSDFERYYSEIASFHLDMSLGFHRVPPVVGRKINVTHDVKRHADKDLLKTFFVSPAGNICFHGQCDYYCDTGHAVCGHPEIMEGSLMAFLPTSTRTPRESWQHPWRRSYHKRKKAVWETDPNYCAGVKKKPPYNSGRRLLDLMDMAVFDFLTGNMDRHHYESFSWFGNFTFTLLYDNGRGFGKSRHDELTILAPIYQCCLMRYSTLQKLMRFYTGPKHLSDIMRESMASDQTSPVLLDKHLTALDRRVNILLKTVYECTRKNRFSNVVKDDGF